MGKVYVPILGLEIWVTWHQIKLRQSYGLLLLMVLYSIRNTQVQYWRIGGGSFRRSSWVLDEFKRISSGILELLAVVDGMTNLAR